jgi:protein-S-isoprenylcysteine O-methyltransferase Ste14
MKPSFICKLLLFKPFFFTKLMGRIMIRMSNDVAHKSWWQIFEVVFGIPFLIAIGMQQVLPISFPRGIIVPAFIPGGVLLIFVGVVLVVLARREFASHGQPTDPGRPTREMITTGVFSISRNPLYLGGVCILLGISLAFNLPWVLLFLLPSIVAGHYILIAPEERYLAATFGEKYDLYTATVHRWFGRKRRLG